MRTGTTVQMISMAVLWVVRDGTGLARALNFTTTIASSASTNTEIATVSQSSKSWNQTMSSITEVADVCSPSSHGVGWPRPAHATPPLAITVTPVTTKSINRLSTSIVLCAPSTRNSALTRPHLAAHRRQDVSSAPLSTAFLPRARQLLRCSGTGGNPGLSNHNSGLAAMRLIAWFHATNGLPPGELGRRIYATTKRLG